MRVALAGLLLALVACGDSATATAVITGTEDDTCDLLDRDDVAAIYGEAYERAEYDTVTVVPSCVVYLDGVGVVTVSWMRPDENVDFDFLRSANDPQAMNEPVDVDGIGDRAFVRLSDAFEDPGVQVVFETDGVLVDVQSVQGADAGDPSAEARDLAAAIAARARFDLAGEG